MRHANLVEVTENSLRHFVTGVGINLLVGHEDRHHGNRLDVLIEALIRTARDRRLRVERILRNQRIGLSVFDRQQSDLILRRNVLHRRRRITRGQERRINRAVLESDRAVCERQELLINVVISDPVSLENLTSIRLCARARCADRYHLALEIVDRLDPRRLEHYELARLGVERRNAAQVFDLAGLVKHLRSVDGIISYVVLNDAELDASFLEHIDVGDGSARSLSRGVDVGNIFVDDLSHRASNRIISAGGAARGDVEELVLIGAVSSAAAARSADCQRRRQHSGQHPLAKG